jgi:glycosyltransferase involved in cell wall biosynthesis
MKIKSTENADHKVLILHIIDEFKIGGAQTHLVCMLKSAKSQFPDVSHIVVSIFNDGAIKAMIEEAGIPAFVLKIPDNGFFVKALSIVGQLCRVIKRYRPCCVEAHLTWSRTLGLMAAWLCRAPLRVGFEHGDTYLTSMPWRIVNYCSQFSAHHIVVCSNALKNWVHSTHHIAKKRMRVFYNAIDLNRFNRDKIKVAFSKKELGLNETTMLFCTVGVLGGGINKRIDIIIQAVYIARKNNNDVALIVCGDGNLRPDLETLAEKLEMKNHIKFLGMRNDIPEILAVCDAFCHAAPFEAFGIVAIEAMAMELAIIVPDSGGIKEIVDNDITGFLYEPLNAHSLADKMALLATKPAKARSMGRAGRETVNRRFNIDNYIKELYWLYALPISSMKNG